MERLRNSLWLSDSIPTNASAIRRGAFCAADALERGKLRARSHQDDFKCGDWNDSFDSLALGNIGDARAGARCTRPASGLSRPRRVRNRVVFTTVNDSQDRLARLRKIDAERVPDVYIQSRDRRWHSLVICAALVTTRRPKGFRPHLPLETHLGRVAPLDRPQRTIPAERRAAICAL